MNSAGKTFKLCLLVLIGIAISGCSRKEVHLPYVDKLPDTLFPTSYLPAWPGSWWKYVSSKGDTSLVTVPESWRADVIEIGDTMEIVHVPVYTGSPLWGNWLRVPSGGGREFVRMVTDSLPPGTTWHGGGSYASGGWVSTFIVKARDTTLSVRETTYSDVVVLLITGGRTSYLHQNQWKYYYAKDVGLVRSEQLTTGITKELVSYSITR